MPEIKKVCANCGEELKESEKYCPICGTKYVAPVVKKVCASCGEELKENERYCPICGTKYDGPVGIPTVVTPPAETPKAETRAAETPTAETRAAETPKAETRAAGMAAVHTVPIISGVGYSTAGAQAAKEQLAHPSNKRLTLILAAAALIGVLAVVYFAVISPKMKEDKYNRAATMIAQGQILEGYNLMKELGTFRNSLAIVNHYRPMLESMGLLNNNSGMNNSANSSADNGVNNSQASTPGTYDSHGNLIMQFPPARSNTLGLPEAKNFNWDMNEKTGVLTIYGNGAMPSYVDDMDGWQWGGVSPWGEYHQDIKQIQVEEGITVITMMAFRFATAEEIYLPHSLQEIDDKAFASVGHLSVIYYNGTMNEWKQIQKARTWDAGTGAYCYYSGIPYRIVCTDGELKQETNPYCGKDARWIYDDRESTVTVYGTGSIDKYNNGDQPWGSKSIKHFAVEEGIKILTDFCTAGRGDDLLETIELPSSLMKLGNSMICDSADHFTVIYHGTMEEWEALLQRSYVNLVNVQSIFDDFSPKPSHVEVICTDGMMDQLSKVYS